MYISLCSLYTTIGYKKDTGYPITVTSISQTIIDCLNNIGLAGGIEELLFALIEVDPDSVIEEDMLECLKLYQKKSLYQRTGFILSQLQEQLNLSDMFFDVCKRRWVIQQVTLQILPVVIPISRNGMYVRLKM